jgi:parallel beta-helix repeat protein
MISDNILNSETEGIYFWDSQNSTLAKLCHWFTTLFEN